MVLVTFECRGCDETTEVENPTTTELSCDCGGRCCPWVSFLQEYSLRVVANPGFFTDTEIMNLLQ